MSNWFKGVIENLFLREIEISELNIRESEFCFFKENIEVSGDNDIMEILEFELRVVGMLLLNLDVIVDFSGVIGDVGKIGDKSL